MLSLVDQLAQDHVEGRRHPPIGFGPSMGVAWLREQGIDMGRALPPRRFPDRRRAVQSAVDAAREAAAIEVISAFIRRGGHSPRPPCRRAAIPPAVRRSFASFLSLFRDVRPRLPGPGAASPEATALTASVASLANHHGEGGVANARQPVRNSRQIVVLSLFRGRHEHRG